MEHEQIIETFPAPTDFGEEEFPSALVTVTNACNLRCKHCFVYREDTPSEARDKMPDDVMLHQLRILRDKHKIRSMLFFGGEPMIKAALVYRGIKLFEHSSIVTNGTYGIPSVPGCLVTVSLDGPRLANDAIRGEGVFDRVRESIFARDTSDGTIVMLQMTITKQNASMIEDFLQEVKDWPVNGVAFTFYVPDKNEISDLAWSDLKERDLIVRKVMALKKDYPQIKSNQGALELMMSDRCLEATGINGENCRLKKTLPLYVGDGGEFERTFCCYGNNVDCSKCGAYAVFNSAYHHQSQPLKR